MKLFTAVVPLLCATFVSSRSLFQQTELQLADPKFKVGGENPLYFCKDPSSYTVDVDYVDLDPNPPVPGNKLTIEAFGTVLKTIEDGAKVQVIVKLNHFITLINQVYDLCEGLAKIDMECPLEKGGHKVYREADIPKIVPPGTYDVFASVIDKDGQNVVCMEGAVTFHRQ